MAKKEISRPATAHIPPFGLRLQPELKERIEQAARAAGRSLNAEIVARLERSTDETESLLLAKALARMEFTLAGVEAQRDLAKAQLGALGRFVVNVLEGRDTSEQARQKLLDTARAHKDALAEWLAASGSSLDKLLTVAERLPPGEERDMEPLLRKLEGLAPGPAKD